jgi:hypothetical protein
MIRVLKKSFNCLAVTPPEFRGIGVYFRLYYKRTSSKVIKHFKEFINVEHKRGYKKENRASKMSSQPLPFV